MVETSNEHNFLSNKDFLTILSALESSDFELSENLKVFKFLVLFCIQNGIWGLHGVFAKLAPSHKMQCTEKSPPTY